jgi:predicted transcriptional regulator
VHAAFTQPGQIFVEAVEMPDGAEFLCVARTLEGPQGAFNERPRRTALLLGCDIAYKDEVVYGAALPGSGSVTPVGPACRLCERSGCLSRAAPPVTRPLGLDEMVTGLSAFDFQ